jgi:hypothetical protein
MLEPTPRAVTVEAERQGGCFDRRVQNEREITTRELGRTGHGKSLADSAAD